MIMDDNIITRVRFEKMSDIGTNKEQSRKLLELGLDPNTADMANLTRAGKNYQVSLQFYEDIFLGDVLAADEDLSWSHSALSSLLPNGKDDIGVKGWGVVATNDDFICSLFVHGEHNAAHGNTPFEAVYNQVLWLLEHGHIQCNDGRLQALHRIP